jgi:hypothetical protein
MVRGKVDCVEYERGARLRVSGVTRCKSSRRVVS